MLTDTFTVHAYGKVPHGNFGYLFHTFSEFPADADKAREIADAFRLQPGVHCVELPTPTRHIKIWIRPEPEPALEGR